MTLYAVDGKGEKGREVGNVRVCWLGLLPGFIPRPLFEATHSKYGGFRFGGDKESIPQLARELMAYDLERVPGKEEA